MAIIKKAKNINVRIRQNDIVYAGEFEIISKEVIIDSTEENLKLISNNQIIKGEGNPSVKFGNVKTIEELTGEPLPTARFRPVVQFFRSEAHAKGLFGAERGSDAGSYGGKFGFDSFHKKVHAEGWVNKYEILRGIEPKDPIVRDYRKCLCAWASIWPPNVPGNMGAGREKITVWVNALEPNAGSVENSGKITLNSSNSNAVKINGKDELTLDIGGSALPVELECLLPFDKDINIRAFDQYCQPVGQLNLYANHEIFTTEIQPVKITFGNSTSTTVNSIPHEGFMQDMLPQFNDGAYNQAYIQAALASHTHEIKLDRSEFIHPKYLVELNKTGGSKAFFLKKNGVSDGDTNNFNKIVAGFYASCLVNEAVKHVAKEDYRKAALAFVAELKKRFKYKGDTVKKTRRMREYKTAYQAWNHPKVKALLPAVEAKQREYGALGGMLDGLDKKGKIYLFYSTGIEGAANLEKHHSECMLNHADPLTAPVSSWIPGYAETGSGVAFLFNSILAENDVAGTIIHEIGHTLGLQHPFDITGNNPPRKQDASGKDILYKNEYEKEIEDVNKKIRSLRENRKNAFEIENLSKKENISLEEAGFVITMRTYYRTVNRNLRLVEDKPAEAIDLYTSCRLLIEDFLMDGEINTGQTRETKSPTEIQLEIDVLERELERLERLREAASPAPNGYSDAKEQSRTLENYMDYAQRAGSPVQSADFRRMLFYHWQWEQMRKTGRERGYLVLNPK